MVYKTCVKSLLTAFFGNRVETAKQEHGFAEIAFSWLDGSPRVDAMRDAAVIMALQEGPINKAVYKHRFSHILFLDSDMAFPENVLERMLRHHDKGIVAGFYTLKGGNYSPVAMKYAPVTVSGPTHYYYDEDYEDTGNELRRENIVGMGCTLIPTEVFDAIGPKPWFQYDNTDDGFPLVSEDVAFCRKAEQAGFDIWLDPTVKCGHVTTHVVTEQWHRAVKDGVIGVMMQAAEQSLV